MTDATRAWLAGLAAGTPDEHETKQLLSRIGLSVPRGMRIGAETAAACPDPRPGFAPPYIVKVCSPEVLHKTDKGGVLFSIDGPGLSAAVRDMADRFPGCGVLVEEQVRFIGNEFIIGAFRDPAFGPAVMVGAGGILTELYKDVAFRLVPCDRQEALRMLKELKVYPVLDGFRGLHMDSQGLSGVIARVSEVVSDLGNRFSQMDINPIVFRPDLGGAAARPGGARQCTGANAARPGDARQCTGANAARPGTDAASRGVWTVLDAKLILNR
jgi:hypothetical protein